MRGFTLVELVVSLALGSILVAAAIDLCARLHGSHRTNETLARLQENAGYALATLEADVRLAGYWGLTNDSHSIQGAAGNAPLPLPAGARGCGAEFAIDLRKPVEAANAAYPLTCAPTGGTAQPQSDVLVVRRASVQTQAADAARLQLYTDRDGGLNRLFLSDTAPGPLTSAEIHNLAVRAYYVSSAGSLRRKTLVAGPRFQDEEIVPMIEDLQVQLGIDPERDDGVASLYVNPDDARLAGALVVSVRVWLRVRAEAPEPGFIDDRTYEYGGILFQPDDAFRRRVVSRTFYVRNSRRS